MRVNARRVIERLDELYACGLREDGSHSRIAYSPQDTEGRRILARGFQSMGITPRTDPAGNAVFRLEGENPRLPALIIGSHLDTVADGGKFDGALGCAAGLGVCEALVQSGRRLKHPLEVIVFADEEGVRFGGGLTGSGAFSSSVPNISPADLDIYGMTRESVYQAFGIRTESLGLAARDPETVLCCLELHIGQGASLWKSGIPIGVVSSIAGVRRSEITVSGEANHAGSTRMADRKDALAAAARFIASVPETVASHGDEYTVATVGALGVKPGSVNVIPGECVFSLEIRDRSREAIDRMEEKLAEALNRACGGLRHETRTYFSQDPAPMTDWVVRSIESACGKLGYASRRVPSGAFHDSLPLSAAFPAGMIFVPSVGGVSHSPAEFSAPEDVERGCDVLLETVLSLGTAGLELNQSD